MLAVICIIFLMTRRYLLGGELGGKNPFRAFSCGFLIMLWFIYVLMVVLQTLNYIPTTIGVDVTKNYRNNPANVPCKY